MEKVKERREFPGMLPKGGRGVGRGGISSQDDRSAEKVADFFRELGPGKCRGLFLLKRGTMVR